MKKNWSIQLKWRRRRRRTLRLTQHCQYRWPDSPQGWVIHLSATWDKINTNSDCKTKSRQELEQLYSLEPQWLRLRASCLRPFPYSSKRMSSSREGDTVEQILLERPWRCELWKGWDEKQPQQQQQQHSPSGTAELETCAKNTRGRWWKPKTWGACNLHALLKSFLSHTEIGQHKVETSETWIV